MIFYPLTPRFVLYQVQFIDPNNKKHWSSRRILIGYKTRKPRIPPGLPIKGAITYSPAFAVPSAWQGLTSLFGMGRGGALALSSP